MRRRQILADDSCVFCGRDESIVHSLLLWTFGDQSRKYSVSN
jgi:hypothetical protein